MAETRDFNPRAAGEAHTMSFGDHLEELRKRLVHALLGIIPIFVVALVFGKSILGILIRPVLSQMRSSGLPASMQSTSVLETFSSYLHVSIIVTVLVGSPWILWQLWRFVAPGLYQHEKRFVYFLLPLSAVLTVIGVLFLYFFILPAMLTFFIHWSSDVGATVPETVGVPEAFSFAHFPVLAGDPEKPVVGGAWVNTVLQQLRFCVATPDGAAPTILGCELTKGVGIAQHYRVVEYINLFLTLALAFALAFQMPVIVLLLGWVGIVDRAFLAKYRRHAVLACAVAGALLTPGDPLSMVLMTIPLYMLYELGGYLLKIFPASRVAGKIPYDGGDPAEG